MIILPCFGFFVLDGYVQYIFLLAFAGGLIYKLITS